MTILILGKRLKIWEDRLTIFKKIQNAAEHIRAKNPDIIFVLVLSQIILTNILEIPT